MNKQIFFITATNTDVGKTYSCEKLLEKYAKDGFKVGYYKPIETGVEDLPLDGNKLLNKAKALNKSYEQIDINEAVTFQFKLPAAPFVSDKNNIIKIATIKEKINHLLNFCDVLFIEGAGGLMVPIKKDYFMIDLIKELQNEFNAKAILICPSNLGSINDTLLSQNALKQYSIKFDWYINLYKDKEKFQEITLPFYKEYFDTIAYI